jgi:hypothetical protein
MKHIPHDLAIVQQVLSTFTPTQRREWYVKMKMSERGQDFAHIANHHHITRQALSKAVQGGSWSPRVVKVLQDDLRADLRPFLTPREAVRFRSKYGGPCARP